MHDVFQQAQSGCWNKKSFNRDSQVSLEYNVIFFCSNDIERAILRGNKTIWRLKDG